MSDFDLIQCSALSAQRSSASRELAPDSDFGTCGPVLKPWAKSTVTAHDEDVLAGELR